MTTYNAGEKMTYQKEVEKLAEKYDLSIDINRDPVWGTTTISLDAPTGYTLDGDLHGYNAYCDHGEPREVAWQDLYDRFDPEVMEKCEAGCDCEWDTDI